MRVFASSARISVLVTLAALVTLAVGGGACSLTTDLNGLAGAPDDGNSDVDGSTVGDGGAPGVSDAASLDAGASVTPFVCADHAGSIFCADFEDTPFDLGWGGKSVGAGGAIASGAGHFGLGLVSTAPVHDDSAGVSAALSTGLSLAPRTPFTLAFAMKLGPTHAVGIVDLPSIALTSPSYFACSLRVDNTGAIVLFHHGDGTGDAPTIDKGELLLFQPATETWVDVTMRVTFPPDEPHMVVTLDGVVAFDGTLDAGPYAEATSTEISVGISRTDGAGRAFEVDLDDVLVTSP